MNKNKTTIEIVNYFLTKDPSLSENKIQKLLYYAQGWSYALRNKPIAFDYRGKELKFEAVDNGVFNSFLHIESKNNFKKYFPKTYFNKDEKQFLNEIWEPYSDFENDELENMIRTEDPWYNAIMRKYNKEISKNDLKNYLLERYELVNGK